MDYTFPTKEYMSEAVFIPRFYVYKFTLSFLKNVSLKRMRSTFSLRKRECFKSRRMKNKLQSWNIIVLN